MADLRGRVMRGAAWTTAGSLIMRIGNLAVGVIAARLLTPHDFGLFAVAMAVFLIVTSIADLGIASVLVRERDDIDQTAPTAVTLSMLSCGGLAVLFWFLAPTVASAFDAPDAVDALRVMCIFVFICGPSSVPVALLTRDFRQDLRFLVDVGSFLIGSGALLAFALMDWGEMAFAWSRVVAQLFVTAALLALAPKRYFPALDLQRAGHLLKIGLPLVATNIVGGLIAGTAVFFISHFESTRDVGIFNLATAISSWPANLLTPILATVGLPLFARLVHNTAMTYDLLTSCMQFIAGLFWPVTMMLAALAPWLVEILYGAKWDAAAPVLSLLAIAATAVLFHSLIAEVLIAGGLTSRYLVVFIGQFLINVVGMGIGVWVWGTEGAAAASAVVAVVMTPIYLLATRPLVASAPMSALAGCAVPLVTASIAALSGHLVGTALDNAWLSLIAGGLTGVVIYLGLTFVWGKRAIKRNLLFDRDRLDEAEAAPAETSHVPFDGREVLS